MGNTSASADVGETGDSKRWFFENVLFFDPVSDEDRETWLDNREGISGPRVKRFTPSSAILCNRNFLIHLTINGKPKDYILKLQNRPLCRMLLCDKRGEMIKEIRTNRLKHVQRQGMMVEVFVRRDRQELSSLTFSFDSLTECDLFCEFIKMLFGIQVYHVGASPLEHFISATERVRHFVAPEDDTNSSDEEHHGRRPTHSAKSCRPLRSVRLGRFTGRQSKDVVLLFVNCTTYMQLDDNITLYKREGDKSSEDAEEVEAARTDKFPIVIEGACETGSTLKLRDVAVRQLHKPVPRVIEWFRSQLPGKDSSFPRTPVRTGPSYRLTEEDVGHYIQLRVLRRLEEAESNPFVYSLAVKGPVTVNSESAKGMLQFLALNEVTLEALVDNQGLHDLYELPLHTFPGVRPFFPIGITLNRTGLRFESKVQDSHMPLKRELQTPFFYVIRPAGEDIDIREDDLELQLHVLNSNIRLRRYVERTVSLRMSSEATRDHLFHTLRLRRLIAKMPSFERWARDLETGNFTNIKQYYARAWEECTWSQYVDFKKAEQMMVAEWNSPAVATSEAVASYTYTSEAIGLQTAGAQYVSAPTAGGVRYSEDLTQSLLRSAAPLATAVNAAAQVSQGAKPGYATSAGRGAAVSKAEPAAGSKSHLGRVAGTRPEGSAKTNNAAAQHAVSAAAGTQGAPISASPALHTPGSTATAVAGSEGAGRSAGAYSERPPGALAPPVTPMKAPAGASPDPVTQGRVNKYAVYAELYRSMNIKGAGQNVPVDGNAAKSPTTGRTKSSQAAAQPKAKAQPVNPVKAPPTQVEAQQHPKTAAPGAVAKVKATPKESVGPAATAGS